MDIDSVVLVFEINKAVYRSYSFFQDHEAMICKLFIILGLAFNHEVWNYNFIIEKSFSWVVLWEEMSSVVISCDSEAQKE